MIRVSQPSAPADFDIRVKNPGNAFLAATPHPNNREWNANNYWGRIHDYLYSCHRGICAYCASWTPRRASPGVDQTTIDHYVAKSRNPTLAYEWANFRLARARMNKNKDDFEDVIDPCSIQTGWFKISFITFKLYAADHLPPAVRTKIGETIVRLQLNADLRYEQERARVIYRYVARIHPFEFVAAHYPFIAAEMVAQDFDNVFKSAFEVQLAKRPSLAA